MVTYAHRWSVAEVRELQEESRAWPRFELIAGELLVTPAPGMGHQLAVGELLVLLSDYIQREHLGVAMASPADLELHRGTVAQPDVFVVPPTTRAASGHGRGWEAVTALLVAIEIVSPGSSRRDRVAKREYYLSAGVPEYWVVDVDARAVERWSAERDDPEVARTTLEWRPAGAREPLTIDLTAMFERIALKRGLIVGA